MPQGKPSRKTVLYIRNLPQDLKDQFKAACAMRNKSMNSTIVKLIRTFVEDAKK